MKRALLRPILQEVSRSFYLTLIIVPEAVRTQLGLAYLLARAADTIADTDLIDRAHRRQYLTLFREQFQASHPSHAAVEDIRAAVRHTQPEKADLSACGHAQAGRILLDHLHDCFDVFGSLPGSDQRLIRELMTTLLKGMEMDLTMFPTGVSDGIIALPDHEHLDRYTYYVAGCVGEFWTKMTMTHFRFLRHWDEEEMCRLGVRFGKGLQMTNVLRDVFKDLRRGRCYLPEPFLHRHGLTPHDLLTPKGMLNARPIFTSLISLTMDHLDQGWHYTMNIPRRAIRLRLACLWPLLFAVKTLRYLSISLGTGTPEGAVKISRAEVYRTMAISSAAVTSNRLLTAYYQHQ